LAADAARAAGPSSGMGSISGRGVGQSVGGGSFGYAAEAADELSTAEETVRNIGNRAFYRRGDRWVDATVTDAQEAKARRVKQFSDEYFELARRYGRTLSQYLVFDEPVLLNVDSQAYLIEP
jgi:Ca-activated chloride channel family protein